MINFSSITKHESIYCRGFSLLMGALLLMGTGKTEALPHVSIQLTSQDEAFHQIAQELGQLARQPHYQAPRIVLIDLFNYRTQERDHNSELLEEGLTGALYHELPDQVVPQFLLVQLRLEWNETYPGSYREPLAEDLVGQAEGDWMITGTFEDGDGMIQLRLELHDMAQEKILWQKIYVYPAQDSFQISKQTQPLKPFEDLTSMPDSPNASVPDSEESPAYRAIPHPELDEPEESEGARDFFGMFMPEFISPPPTQPPPPDGMVRIPGGEFVMGDPAGHPDEQPEHLVLLPKFFLDLHEVTNSEFTRCQTCERGQGGFDTKGPDQPVVYVDWTNALEYCSSMGKRLPTEAEWEHAARAGGTKDYPFGEDPEKLLLNAWFEENTIKKGLMGAQPVLAKQANLWGVFDLQGNVMEWVNDYYAPDYSKVVSNSYRPQGPMEPVDREYPLRVVRGGAWGGLNGAGKADGLRVSRRYAFAPWVRSFQIGFRCASDDPAAEG